jgi:hypothetical protein
MSKSKMNLQVIVIILFIIMAMGTTVVIARADTSEVPIDEDSEIPTREKIVVDDVTPGAPHDKSEEDLVQPEMVVAASEWDEVRSSAISWDTLQAEIDSALDGDVIDLSGLSTPEGGKAYTFIVGSNRTLTFKSNGSRIKKIAFVFNDNNNITIENMNIDTANNHVDANDSSKKGYSPLHFTGRGNILTLKGYNTILSGQTVHASGYGASIGVPSGAELTISNESNGELDAVSGVGGAGIGGGYDFAGGNITIAGGTITSRSSYWSVAFSGAGIGGGFHGEGGNITITGGKITTRGGAGGAGIGGGTERSGGNITITGGTIHSTGGLLGAGIGGGNSSAGGNIVIAGGSVCAISDAGIDNIGAGNSGTGGTLKNSAGEDVYLNTLTIPGKSNSAITAGSINGVACIDGMPTGGAYGIKNVSTDANGKVYFYLPISGNSGSTKESIRLTTGSNTGYVLYARGSMTMEKRLSLLDSNPQDWDEVEFYVNFSSLDTVNLSELSTPGDSLVYTINVNSGRSFALKGNGEQIENVAFVFKGNNTITIEDLNLKSANNHVDSNDSSKKGYSPLHFTGKNNILIFKGTNTVISGQTIDYSSFGAGIGVTKDAELTINTINGDTTSCLNATSGYRSVGIGNVDYSFMGSENFIINICGGTVNATGGVDGAGIGGKISKGMVNISGGTVNATGINGNIINISGGTVYSSGSGSGIGSIGLGTTTVNISGGTVTAIGGTKAAGIGAGFGTAFTTVNISGGIVTATGGLANAGIGGYGTKVNISGGRVTAVGGNGSYSNGKPGIGYEGSGGTINISGGTVIATGGAGYKESLGGSSYTYPSGSGISGGDNLVTISGGTVNAKGSTDIDGTVINGMGAPVFLNTLTLTNAINADIMAGSINGITCVADAADGIAYGIKDVKTDADGKVYFYLPASDETEMVSLTADGVVYSKRYQRLSDDNGHTLLVATEVTVTAPEDIIYGQLLSDPIATALMGGNNFTYSYSGTGGTSYGPTETKPSSVGSYVITATLVSETHSGIGTAEFSILPKALTSDMLTITGTCTYNGLAQTPDYTVADGSIILAPDTDYENVIYSNNIAAGTAALSITGKGNYSGSVSKSFHINKVQLTVTGSAINRVYNGSTTVDVHVTPTNKIGDDRITITAGGTLLDPNAGVDKPVIISGFQLTGEDAGNYIVPDAVTNSVTVNIDKAEEPSIASRTVRAYYNEASTGRTVNLAELIPADCGTTSYTVTSSNMLVTNINVDSNGKLTFDTDITNSARTEDITVKAIMQNYDDATINITVEFAEKRVPIDGDSDPIIIPDQGMKPEQPENSVVITTGNRDNGPARVLISRGFITGAIGKAISDTNTQGNAANGITVEMNVTMPKGAGSLSALLPRNSLNSLVEAGVERLTILGQTVNVSLGRKTLKLIQEQTSGTVTISITPLTSRLSGAKAIIGNRPIYEIKFSYVKDGKTVTIYAYSSGNVTVVLPNR